MSTEAERNSNCAPSDISAFRQILTVTNLMCLAGNRPHVRLTIHSGKQNKD